jgi:hypothetical protein
MKSVTYPVRFKQEEYDRLVAEAKRRGKTLADLFRDIVTYGVPALPPLPEDYEAVQSLWDSLGPPPEINYEALPKDW